MQFVKVLKLCLQHAVVFQQLLHFLTWNHHVKTTNRCRLLQGYCTLTATAWNKVTLSHTQWSTKTSRVLLDTTKKILFQTTCVCRSITITNLQSKHLEAINHGSSYAKSRESVGVCMLRSTETISDNKDDGTNRS